jgi:antitoxin (DNA-binding transcriptional repressor) of toxin-antitoxin stability system
MTRISVKEARGNFRKLLERVAAGEEIAVMKRGKEIARIVRPPVTKPFPDLSAFRSSLKVKGEPLSKTIIRMRREARY